MGRPPEALTFYHDSPDIRDDWVIHLAEPVFTARVSGAQHVVSATSVTGDKLQVTSDIGARVIQALRSYYYLFFASLDDLYARYNKPFALALYMDPTLDPAARDYQPDYEFDEAFTLAMDEWRTKDVFHINVAEAEVHRNGELLTAAADMLDFYLSDHALAALWHEGWFESASVPVKDFSVWPPFPRDNPHIILASTLLSAFLNGLAINSGNVLALRLCIPLARELALTLRANQASITGKQLLRWINSKLTLPAGSPVDLFDEIVAETPCAIT